MRLTPRWRVRTHNLRLHDTYIHTHARTRFLVHRPACPTHQAQPRTVDQRCLKLSLVHLRFSIYPDDKIDNDDKRGNTLGGQPDFYSTLFVCFVLPVS